MPGGELEFADTNVVLYTLDRNDPRQAIAKRVLNRHPIVSVQVLSEASNTLFRKYNQPRSVIVAQLGALLEIIGLVVPIDDATMRRAWDLWQRYQFSWFDSLILASALNSNCQILYSEDFQHGQIIDDRLRILNPFLAGVFP